MTNKLLQANLKAAELLEFRGIDWDVPTGKKKSCIVSPTQGENDWRPFSIANPSDRDAVVQMLGKKHGIIFYITKEQWAWDFDFPAAEASREPSYQDAVVAAVLAV